MTMNKDVEEVTWTSPGRLASVSLLAGLLSACAGALARIS